MARLPDETALGSLEAGTSGRPTATYDTTGYARGAAAIGEGVKDLGSGIATAGKGLAVYAANAAQKAAAEQKLQLARGNVELTAKELARANAIERESDPVGMVERHASEAAKEFEQAAQHVSDPRLRANLLLHRDGYVAGVTRAATQKETVLSADGGMAADLDMVNMARDEALKSSDPEAINRTVDVFHGVVDGWQGTGWIDQAKAVDLKRNWATDLAERALLEAPATARLAAIEAMKPEVADAATASADTGTQPAADQTAYQHGDLTQLARMLPAELVRENTERNAQGLVRIKAAINLALNEGTLMPSADDIASDPDLDAPSRARLEQSRQQALDELENYAWFTAKFDDLNAGSFNALDPDTRRFADRIYKARGANDAALYVVVRRTGMMPPSARNLLLGDLASGEPARVKRAVDTASWINEEFPGLLSIEEDGERLLNAVTQLRHETARGTSAEESVKRIIELQSSESRRDSDDRQSSADLDAAVAKAISVTDLIGLPTAEPDAAASMFAAYADLVKDRYAATRDMSLAKAQARALLEARWNITPQADASPQSNPGEGRPPSWWELLSETWPGRAVQSAYSGFTAPGDAVAGRITSEEELLERVSDMSGLITGGSFVKPQIAAPEEVILGMGATRSARRIRAIVNQKAGFGTSTSKEYRTTFFKANPGVPRETVVHHAVEQRTLKMYPGLISESEMHSLQNLRGIPKSKNNELHLSIIRKEWDDFYLKNPTTTKKKLLNKAMEIDRKWGSNFIPPLKFTKPEIL
jgi:hypothetical protein